MFKKITSAIVSAAMLAGMTAGYAPSAVNAAGFKAIMPKLCKNHSTSTSVSRQGRFPTGTALNGAPIPQ